MKDAQLEEDLQALAKAFLLLKTEEECTAFLKDVCTYQELRALSQRLHVARLLRKQYVFHEIVQENPCMNWSMKDYTASSAKCRWKHGSSYRKPWNGSSTRVAADSFVLFCNIFPLLHS